MALSFGTLEVITQVTNLPPIPDKLWDGHCRMASPLQCLPMPPDSEPLPKRLKQGMATDDAATAGAVVKCFPVLPILPPLRRTLTQFQPIGDEIPCPRCAAKYANVDVVDVEGIPNVPDVPCSLPPLEKECPDCHDLGFLKVFPPQP